jgi:hypothetical protein
MVDDRRETSSARNNVTTLKGMKLLNANRDYSRSYTQATDNATQNREGDKEESIPFEIRIITSYAYRISNGPGRILTTITVIHNRNVFSS